MRSTAFAMIQGLLTYKAPASKKDCFCKATAEKKMQSLSKQEGLVFFKTLEDSTMQGNQVDYLIGTNSVPTSEFTYWVPPPAPPSPPGEQPPPPSGPPSMIKVWPDIWHVFRASNVLCLKHGPVSKL